ncbi:Uncharacterised protein [Mycobacteroides abscessus subsp. abscessus]|nr:Uncharacterised protein [Mycobacteroides abscessus subsp. abscessus]
MYITASAIMVAARQIAEWTALAANTMPSAPSTASGASIQNCTASPVEARVRGSAASTSVTAHLLSRPRARVARRRGRRR